MQELLKSKRFWAAVGSVVVVLFKDRLPEGVTEEQVQSVLLVIAAWIVGDSLRQTVPAGKRQA